MKRGDDVEAIRQGLMKYNSPVVVVGRVRNHSITLAFSELSRVIWLVFRSAAAIVASLIAALVLVIAVEGVSAVFHPFPPGADPSDLETCKAHVAKYPAWLLALASVCWASTVFVSVWLATRLGASRHPAHGIVIGVLLFAAAGFNVLMLPYPIWFEISVVLLFPLAIFAGAKTGRGRSERAGQPELDTRDE